MPFCLFSLLIRNMKLVLGIVLFYTTNIYLDIYWLEVCLSEQDIHLGQAIKDKHINIDTWQYSYS